MKKYHLSFFISLISLITFSQSSFSKETLEKIKEVENNITGNIIYNDELPSTILQRMAKYNVKGMSIAVIHNYKLAWAKGYGWADVAKKKPVTTKTLFEPGSISKTLNAVGILKLAQDKRVDLYTDINEYLTSWKFPYDTFSKGKKVNLAQLLSHQAGLTVHGFPGHNILGEIPTVYQVLDGKYPAVTPPVRSKYEPDLKFEYSGGGTTISQVILTDVTRQPYDNWMFENVLKPIGMVNSSYSQPLNKVRHYQCATGYYRDGKPILNNFHVYPEQAAAGLWMTPSDLANYIIDMQLAYQGKPSKVLSQEMVKLHLTPYNNGPSAMGTFIDDLNGAKYFQHSAGNDGFCGFFFASLEDGNGLVVFLNSEDGKLLSEINSSVAKAYNWKNFYKEPQRKKTEKIILVPESALKVYEGFYLYEGQWSAVEKKNNKYYFYTGNTHAKMHFTSPTRFFNTEFASVKEFVKDETGKVTGYTRKVDDKEYPSATKIIDPDTMHLENNICTDIGWHLFENGNYSEALRFFKRGVALYPADLNMKINLAHLHLYNNEFEKAINIYKSHLGENIYPTVTWEQQLQNDFMYFKEHHFSIKPFDKVFNELNIKRPKGY